MGEPRADKVAVVAEVKEKLEAADGVLLTDYRGLRARDGGVAFEPHPGWW